MHLLFSPSLIITGATPLRERERERERGFAIRVRARPFVRSAVPRSRCKMVDEKPERKRERERERESGFRGSSPRRGDDWRGFSTNYRPTRADCGNRGLADASVDGRMWATTPLGKAAFLPRGKVPPAGCERGRGREESCTREELRLNFDVFRLGRSRLREISIRRDFERSGRWITTRPRTFRGILCLFSERHRRNGSFLRPLNDWMYFLI